MELLSPLRTADPSFLAALWRGCVCPPAFPERTDFFGSQLAAPARQVLRMCPQRHYTPILPLFICGLLLIYWGRSEGQTSSPGPQSALAPPVQRRFGCWWDATVGWHPKQIRGLQRPRRQRSPKGKGDQTPQQNKVEFGLPASVVQAVQSISTRSTQDLWGPAPAALVEATAEQNFQRRSNATNRLAKRLGGNVRANCSNGSCSLVSTLQAS